MNWLFNIILWIIACFHRHDPPTPTPAPVIPTPAPSPPIPNPAPAPTPAPDPDREIAEQLLQLHNEARAKHGKPPLTLNDKLCKSAKAHADHMVKVNKLAHMLIGDGSPSDRITKAGYQWSSLAENIAWGQQDAKEVTQAWMDDIPHRMNILSRNKEMGAAMAQTENGRAYWCVDFGTPA